VEGVDHSGRERTGVLVEFAVKVSTLMRCSSASGAEKASG
jgi:hypothetical protein